MIFWTADEHYGHRKILEYCCRPFATIEEMDEELIRRHNSVVKPGDTVIHVGDFTLIQNENVVIEKYVTRLEGINIFLRGSHDSWLGEKADSDWEGKVGDQYVFAYHYACRVWSRSHYGSWQVHGHSHGQLPPLGKQHDVGVDNNDFFPVSFERLEKIMATRGDNPNLLDRLRG